MNAILAQTGGYDVTSYAMFISAAQEVFQIPALCREEGSMCHQAMQPGRSVCEWYIMIALFVSVLWENTALFKSHTHTHLYNMCDGM